MTLAAWFYSKHPRRPSDRRPRRRSRPRSHAFRLEPLEPRLLLSADDLFLAALALQLEPATGVTVITHGVETTAAGGNSLLSLARAIEERTGGWLVDWDAGATVPVWSARAPAPRSLSSSTGPGPRSSPAPAGRRRGEMRFSACSWASI